MKTPTPQKKTLDQFLAELSCQNKTLSDWARERSFSLHMVFAVARGRANGKRGQSRAILLAMGVEPPPMFATRPPAVSARAPKAA